MEPTEGRPEQLPLRFDRGLAPLVLLFGVSQLRVSAWSPFQSRAMGRQLEETQAVDKKWFLVIVIALTFGIPQAIEAQRQTPPSQVEDKDVKQRLAEIEQKLEGLVKEVGKQGTKRPEASDERAKLIDRRFSDVERRLSDVERKLSNFLHKWGRIKRHCILFREGLVTASAS